MSLTDIAYRINELASSWEQFKLINDRKLKEMGVLNKLCQTEKKVIN